MPQVYAAFWHRRAAQPAHLVFFLKALDAYQVIHGLKGHEMRKKIHEDVPCWSIISMGSGHEKGTFVWSANCMSINNIWKKNQCLMLMFTCCTSNDTERNVEKGCLFGSDDENRDHFSFHVQLEAPPNYEAYPGSISTPFFLVSILSIYTYTW